MKEDDFAIEEKRRDQNFSCWSLKFEETLHRDSPKVRQSLLFDLVIKTGIETEGLEDLGSSEN